MVLPQRMPAAERFEVVPPALASVATRYQRARAVEKAHLDVMAKHDLLADWSDDVRTVVIEARGRIHEARAAREAFRRQVREFVIALRTAGEPLSAVLRHTRSMMHLIERSGALEPDDGWLEAEVLEWAIEEYEMI